MERLQQSSNAYIKSMSARDQGAKQEKQLPVGHFGTTMVSHGDDFEPDSEFGQCLLGLGRANERIARMQETYCANATSSWLESVERSMIQMKEYQAAKKKLESRRLAFDTATINMQKSKKEDYRKEEELRSQKAKYEESNEEVFRRMLDIKEAEVDSVADLTTFLEAELTYYDRCKEVLLQLKREWPASVPASNRSDTSSPVNGLGRRMTNSRANSISQIAEDEPLEPPRPPMISSRASSGTSSPTSKPQLGRSVSGFEGPTSLVREREHSPPVMPRLSRAPTEPATIQSARNGLRVTKRGDENGGVFGDDQSDDSDTASTLTRATSWSMQGQNGSLAKKPPPPPPPPSRSKKPPPPPPLKRSALSTSEVPNY